MVLAELATEKEDPVARLHRIAAAMKTAKRMQQADAREPAPGLDRR